MNAYKIFYTTKTLNRSLKPESELACAVIAAAHSLEAVDKFRGDIGSSESRWHSKTKTAIYTVKDVVLLEMLVEKK